MLTSRISDLDPLYRVLGEIRKMEGDQLRGWVYGNGKEKENLQCL